MKVIIIAFCVYVIIGLILYFFQEEWVKENDEEFLDEVDTWNWFKYFLICVLFWFPYLIAYLIYKANNQDE